MPDTTLVPIKPVEQSLQDVILQKGPLTILASGGGLALYKGLIPMFDIHQATFGAILLVVTALANMFIWVMKRRTAQQVYYKKQQGADDARGHLESIPDPD